MGGSSVFTSTLGIKFADGTTQITAAFGAWLSGMPYLVGNTVYFGGSYWAALASNTGSQPSTSNPDWARFTPSGVWSPTEAYAIDSEVTYLGVNYIAITPNGPTATTPDLNPTAWARLGGNATEIQGILVSPVLPDHNGEILIYDSVSNTYVPGDPLVQGLFPEGTATSGINPILVSGRGADGLQHSLSVDNSGVLNVNVAFPGTIAVTGTFWQDTQPVSIASLPLPSGAATEANQITELAYLASLDAKTPTLVGGSIPVTGTFWQDTQPVSGTVAVSNFPATQVVSGTIAVTGTFWQDTQPVSIAGTVAVSLASTTITGSVAVTGTFWQATQPVSGTFWQATQPVSGEISFTAPQHVIIDSGTLGTLTIGGSVSVSNFPATQPVSIATMPTTPVTGTFWQATQPVSGTFWQATQPVSGTVAVSSVSGSVAVTGTFWQAIQPVSGTFWQDTQPVSGSVSVSNFPATQPVSGTVTALQGTSPWVVSLASTTITGSVAVTGTFWQAIQPISGSISFTAPQHVIVDSATLGTVAVSGAFWQAVQPVSGTVTVNQGTSPWVVSLASTTITGTVDISDRAARLLGHVTVDNASIAVTGTFWQAVQPVSQSGTWNIGTLTSITNPVAVTGTFWQALQPVSLTSTTITGTVAVTQSTSPWVITGNKTNNNAAPAGDNVGVLPAVANAVAPTWTEGDQVLLSEDLKGGLRINQRTPQTPAAPTSTSVGVTSALIVAANANRTGLVLTNLSNKTISLGLAATAVLSSGIVLAPGATWIMDAFTFVTGAINAISTGAASTLAIQELS